MGSAHMLALRIAARIEKCHFTMARGIGSVCRLSPIAVGLVASPRSRRFRPECEIHIAGLESHGNSMGHCIHRIPAAKGAA